MPRRSLSTSVTIALLALLGLVLLAPIFAVVRAGFLAEDGSWTVSWFVRVFQFEVYREGLWNSLMLAVCTTGLCLVIAIPLAVLAENYNFWGKRWWLGLIMVPMILPPFVGAVGLRGLLSRNGGINLFLQWLGVFEAGEYIDFLAYPFWSCVVLEALSLYPITFLNVQAALANIDPALHEAARNLGASSWRRFWTVTLPLMRPGVFAGSTIVFIWAFTELGTPLMVGYTNVTAVQVFHQIQTTNPEGDAYALVVIMLAASVLLYLVGKLVLGRPLPGMLAKATVAMPPVRPGRLGNLLITGLFAGVFFIAVLPHVSVVLASITATGIIELAPEHLTLRFHANLVRDVVNPSGIGDQTAALSVLNSFRYALAATAINIVFGFVIAYLVVRRRSWLTMILDSLAMLPLAVPGLVMAFGYFIMTLGDSPFAFLNPITHDPMPLLVTAYAVRRLPFLVRSCAAGLEQTSEALEEASINLGASPLRTMLTVTVPLLAANFIAGGLLVFSRSMLEVSDSLILAFDKQDYPMTKAIYSLADSPQSGLQMASALGVWGMVILTVTILGASLALGKRLGALFRV
ncbi:MAG: iron ABC transporter permease [Phycisphaerales bacterium]|nr:iron ABC transporter permease [Phycisphaerales bacterium]